MNVSEVIARLSYDGLVESSIIPDVRAVIGKTSCCKLPAFVSTAESLVSFEMLWIDIFKSALGISIQSISFDDALYRSLDRCRIATHDTSGIEESVYGCVSKLAKHFNVLMKTWNDHPLLTGRGVTFDDHFSSYGMDSTVDISVNNIVLDIETTRSFDKISKRFWLRMLAHCSLMRESRKIVTHIGVILTMQKKIFLFDVSGWDHANYVRCLIECSRVHHDVIDFGGLGSHASRGSDMASSLVEYSVNRPNTPVQMFLPDPRKDEKIDIVDKISRVIRDHDITFFTHTSFLINLCSPESQEWSTQLLIDDIITTRDIGGRGVVVHTGARTTRSIEDALNSMEIRVRRALSHATVECPLLLETPCGEGTEVCICIEELDVFFQRFDAKEKNLLGLCVDTCHVFACGYDPLCYLQHWEEYSDVSIRLVHFNDSDGECDSRRDRHQTPGHGHIGVSKMEEIRIWCLLRGIPMIME